MRNGIITLFLLVLSVTAQGQNLASFGSMEKLTALYTDFFSVFNEPEWTQYALSDVDEDGTFELFLADGQDHIAVFALNGGDVQLACGADDKLFLSFYRHCLCYSGHAGAVGFLAGYTLLENSRIKWRVTDLSEWDYALDDFGESTYHVLEGDVTVEQVPALINQLGDPIDGNLEWKDF